MKTMKTIFSMLVTCLMFSACSSAPRSKWTDKNMRICIDPDSVSPEHYVQIQTALVETGKFTVVDRASGMSAVKKEQERLQRNEVDRYEDKEKWAHWGKMYGVGSIVVAHAQCRRTGSFWNPRSQYLNCKQFLSMVDANTGEVFLAVDGENDGPSFQDREYQVPDWKDVVEKLVKNYPEQFRSEQYAGPARIYQEVSEEHAKRQKEEVNRNTASHETYRNKDEPQTEGSGQ